MAEEKVALLAKYRVVSGKLRLLTIGFTAVALTLTLAHWFHWTPFGFIMYPMTFLFMLISAFLPLNYLWIPASKNAPRHHVPLYDMVLAAVSFAIPLYFMAHQREVNIGGWDVHAPTFAIALATILWILMVEAARRAGGVGLAVVVSFFGIYPLFACLSPLRIMWGPCISFNKLVSQQMISDMGLMGMPLEIFGELVMGFIVFAAVVQSTGAGKFFNDMAVALVGKTRGGTAKVSIVASGLFGSISGAVVPNVMTTGAFTIPAMKREGLESHFAAGVEATASAGGTLMPPVMGAVAFIMSEVTEVPYLKICIAALVPAILYFFCIFVQIDSHAARIKLKPLPLVIQPPPIWLTLLRNYHIIIGFILLVAVLFLWRITAQAPYIASAVVIVLFTLQKRGQFGLRDFVRLLESIGRTLADLLPILASVGLVLGGLTFTGIALSIPHQISLLAGDNSIVLLLISAFAALILGMGMTAAAVYIFLAIVVAPGLVQYGFNFIAVHLFILYYGMLSHITPPVAIAAFAAASIAESSPMKTGFMAMRLGIAKYILPFIFVISPALILQGSISEILWVVPTVAIGLAVFGGALEGYMWGLGTLKLQSRVLLLAVGLTVLMPDFVVKIIGLGILLAIFILGKMQRGSFAKISEEGAYQK
ncbi:TRAP transporter permease [Chloroflexota bacterium]